MSKLSDRRREIQAMDIAGAQAELETLRRRLFELRLQKERGEVKDNRQFPKVKKDIARLMAHLTDLTHEEMLAAAGVLSDETAETAETAETTSEAKA